MREILCKGKRVDNNEWVTGFYVKVLEHYKSEMSGKSYIVSINNGIYFEVIPETVCEFTGLTDKNGKKIFEGDKVISEYGYGPIGTVEWDDRNCSFIVNIGYDELRLTDNSKYVVYANINDF